MDHSANSVYLITAVVFVVVFGIFWLTARLCDYFGIPEASAKKAIPEKAAPEKPRTAEVIKRIVLYRAHCLSGRHRIRQCDVVAKLNDGRVKIHIDGQPDEVFHRRHASKIFPFTSSLA